jgi:hypothetical protein
MSSGQGGDEFDFASFIQSPLQVITGAMSAADTARRSFGLMIATVESLQRSAQQLESILARIDAVVSIVEGPAKALAPEMDRFAGRLREVGDVMDGPIMSMLPNLERLGAAIERANLEQFPEVLDALTGQLRSFGSMLGDLPKRLGPLGDLFGGPAGLLSAWMAAPRRGGPPPPPPPPPPPAGGGRGGSGATAPGRPIAAPIRNRVVAPARTAMAVGGGTAVAPSRKQAGAPARKRAAAPSRKQAGAPARKRAAAPSRKAAAAR